MRDVFILNYFPFSVHISLYCSVPTMLRITWFQAIIVWLCYFALGRLLTAQYGVRIGKFILAFSTIWTMKLSENIQRTQNHHFIVVTSLIVPICTILSLFCNLLLLTICLESLEIFSSYAMFSQLHKQFVYKEIGKNHFSHWDMKEGNFCHFFLHQL